VKHRHTFRYGAGESAADLTVDLPVRRCGVCGFEFLDSESERIKLEAICEHLGVLSPSGIRCIRERYGMTQAKFAEVTGLGTATLVRWENGAMNHTRAYDRYIRLLENPEIMRQLRGLAEPVDFGGEPGTGDDCRWRLLRVTDRSWRVSFGLRHSRSAAARRARRGRQGTPASLRVT
jgi:putative zinc finger/helix-turn-helix YgiT family protein